MRRKRHTIWSILFRQNKCIYEGKKVNIIEVNDSVKIILWGWFALMEDKKKQLYFQKRDELFVKKIKREEYNMN